MEKYKTENKGITLIALIITIVIMLILATVTIGAINGGLFNYAGKAKKDVEIVGEKEKIEQAFIMAKGISKTGRVTKEDLQKKLGDASEYTVVEEDNIYKVTMTQSNRTYLLDKSGNVTLRGKWGADYITGRISINEEEVKSGNEYLEIGDVIVGYDPTNGAKYNEVISYGESTQMHPSANGYADTVFRLVGEEDDDNETEEDETAVSYDLSKGWKLLGVTTAGNLMITTADVVRPVSVGNTNTGTLNYYLKGRTGYKYAIEELDKISNLYGQGKMAINSRSINMDDINKITGYDPKNIDGNGTPYGKDTLQEYGNRITYYWKGDRKPYYKPSNQDSLKNSLTKAHNSFYYINEENWEISTASTTATAESMEKITDLISTYYSYEKSISGGSTNAKKMIFLLVNSYWLATNFFEPLSNECFFGVFLMEPPSSVDGRRFVYSWGSESNNYYSNVRPVVILDNNININYINGAWTISEVE